MEQVPGRFARYQLEALLGEGATARVYRAYDPSTDQRIALKILKEAWRGDRELVDRFLRDARAAGPLKHPCIVSINTVEETPAPFINMEFIEGRSLAQVLAAEGRMRPSDSARIVRELGEALTVVHAGGRVHRDIKPSNVLLAEPGRRAKLVDFGTAKIDRPEATLLMQHGEMIGTPRYMAPEQVRGESTDARSDLFSLGATFYEMLSGACAFPGETLVSVTTQIIHAEPRPLRELAADVPLELVGIVGRLLEKDPARRFGSAAELVTALRQWESLGETRGKPPVGVDQLRPAGDRTRDSGHPPMGNTRSGTPRTVLAAVCVITAMGLAALGFWTFKPSNEAPMALMDRAETSTGTPVRIAVLANDGDLDPGDELTLIEAMTESGAPGRVTLDGNALVYDPGDAFAGIAEGQSRTVKLRYKVRDSAGAEAEGNVEVVVRSRASPLPPSLPQLPQWPPSGSPPAGILPELSTPVRPPRPSAPVANRPPAANDDRVEVAADGSLLITPLANDRDPDQGDTLSLADASFARTPQGRITPMGDAILYDPVGGFADLPRGERREVELGYTVRDRFGESDNGRIIVSVIGVREPAVAPSAPQVSQPPQPVPPERQVSRLLRPPVVGSIDEALLLVKADLLQHPCTRLEVDGSAPLRLHGTVADGSLRDTLLDRVRALSGIANTRIDILPPGSTSCSTLDLLNRLTLPSARRFVWLEATPDCPACNKTVQDLRLVTDDRLVVRAEIPDGRPFLIIDYLMADNNVYHAFPPPNLNTEKIDGASYTTPWPFGSNVWIGDKREPFPRTLTIAAPFGHEMIVAVASKTPLFRATRPLFEPLADYLRDLQVALSQVADSDDRRPLASVVSFETATR